MFSVTENLNKPGFRNRITRRELNVCSNWNRSKECPYWYGQADTNLINLIAFTASGSSQREVPILNPRRLRKESGGSAKPFLRLVVKGKSKRSLVIHKWFIMLLGMLMGSQAAAGQIPEPQIVLAQKSVAPVITVFRAESTPLLAPFFLLARNREKSLARARRRRTRGRALQSACNIRRLSYTERCTLRNRNGMTLGARCLPWNRQIRTSLRGCRESKAVSAGDSKHFLTKSS